MHPEFNYHSVVGKLNFLEKSMCPDLAYAVHQCTHFSANPTQLHTNAVKHIGHYLKATPTLRITLCPDNQKSFQCWVDADFSSNWKPERAKADPMTAKSCSGWITMYTGCPITWVSKLQTLMALSTTKAEYMALSMAMHEQLPLLCLLEEVMIHNIDMNLCSVTIHYKAFEDNSRALEMVKVPKLHPCTKHLNNTYHNFCENMQTGQVKIVAVKSKDQLTDLLTNPL